MVEPRWQAWWREVCAGVDAGAAPGVSTWVSVRGEVVVDAVHGLAQSEPTPIPLTPELRFDLASVTKALSTTLCVMALVEDGRLDLDRPVAGALTPRLLLTHQSGLPAHRLYYQTCADRDDVRRAVLHTGPETTPGTFVVYSDVGFLRLGFLTEELTNQRQDEWLRARLLGPAGVADALGYGPLPPEQAVATERCLLRGLVIRGEVHDENAWRCDGVAGHAGLFGTAAAVGRFTQALVRGEVLAPATLTQMLAVRHDHAGERFLLGWKRLSYDTEDTMAFGHDGFTGCLVWVAPRWDLVLVLLTNRVHPSRDNRLIYDLRPDWVRHAARLAAGQTP